MRYRVLALLALLVAIPLTASATPCPIAPTTLDVVMAMGSCTLGDKLFAPVLFSAFIEKDGGFPSFFPASDFTFQAVNLSTASPGFILSTTARALRSISSTAGHFTQAGFDLLDNPVSTLSGLPLILGVDVNNVHLSASSGTVGDGNASVGTFATDNNLVCGTTFPFSAFFAQFSTNGGSVTLFQTDSQFSGGCSTNNILAEQLMSLNVTNDASAGFQSAEFSFDQTAASAVPEPSSLVLFGSGLIALVGAFRLASRHQRL